MREELHLIEQPLRYPGCLGRIGTILAMKDMVDVMLALLPRTRVEDIADDIERIESVAGGTWEDADKNKQAQG